MNLHDKTCDCWVQLYLELYSHFTFGLMAGVQTKDLVYWPLTREPRDLGLEDEL